MPKTPDNTPDNRPTNIELPIKTLKQREAEEVGYQELKGHIWEVMTLIEANSGNSKNTIERSFGKAHFHGFELTESFPDQERLQQPRIRLLRVDLDDMYKTPARVMVSLDFYPAGLDLNGRVLLRSLDYTLEDKLLKRTKQNKVGKMYGKKITPGTATFDSALVDVKYAINAARKMVQGLSL